MQAVAPNLLSTVSMQVRVSYYAEEKKKKKKKTCVEE